MFLLILYPAVRNVDRKPQPTCSITSSLFLDTTVNTLLQNCLVALAKIPQDLQLLPLFIRYDRQFVYFATSGIRVFLCKCPLLLLIRHFRHSCFSLQMFAIAV